MNDADPASMEKLASRLAMLASDTGEADNAGRAFGAMARRLGLTGGDLKEIFLEGLGVRAQAMPKAEAARIARENVVLRHSVEAAEILMRSLTHERDALRNQNAILAAAAERRKLSGRVGLVLAIGLLSLVMIGTLVAFMGPSFRTAQETHALQAERVARATAGNTPFRTGMQLGANAAAGASGAERLAQVRARGAPVRNAPDTASPVVASLPPGAHIGVRRLFWNALVQWAEIDVDGRNAYLVTTDVDLP